MSGSETIENDSKEHTIKIENVQEFLKSMRVNMLKNLARYHKKQYLSGKKYINEFMYFDISHEKEYHKRKYIEYMKAANKFSS